MAASFITDFQKLLCFINMHIIICLHPSSSKQNYIYTCTLIYQGAGNWLSPRIIALPTIRGQLIIFSKKLVQSLMNGNRSSNAMRRTHHLCITKAKYIRWYILNCNGYEYTMSEVNIKLLYKHTATYHAQNHETG